MKRRAAILLAALATSAPALLAAGCGDERSSERTAAADARARLLRTGERVFAEHCQTCHPLLGRPDGRVHSDFVPALDLDQVSPSPANVRERLRFGGVAMGSFDAALSAAQRRAVAAYVLEVGGRETAVPRDTRPSVLERGRGLYAQHCQACHALAGRPPTNPNPIWVATDFDEVRPGVLWVERLMRDGLREGMPSFRERLSLRETRAVALYVNAAARGGPAARP